MNLRNNLELIAGPVCCGKSEELLRRITRYDIAGYNVLLVKPLVDTRSKTVRSRNGSEKECIEIASPDDIFLEIKKYNNSIQTFIEL